MPVIKRGIVKKKSKPKRSSFTGKGLTLANLEKSRNERKEAEASKSALLSRTLLTMQQRREEQYYDEDFTMGDEDTEDEADSLTGRKTDLVPEEIETVHPDGTIEVLKVPIGHIKEEEEPIISDAPADEHSDLVRARRIARFSTLFATAANAKVEDQAETDDSPINAARQCTNGAEERTGRLRSGRLRVTEGRRLGQ